MAHTITIDGSGRLVIPKGVRQRNQLLAGARLALLEEEGRLVLVPIANQPATKESGGLLVFTGHLASDHSDHRRLREARLNRLAERP